MVWADGLGPEDVPMASAAAILDSGVRIGNRCKGLPGNSLVAAVILDFGLRLGNHCMVPPATTVATTAFRVRI